MKLRQLEEFGKKLFSTSTKACVQKVTAKYKNSVSGYRLMRVAVIYAGEWCYILAESRNVSVCHVLCVMLERVLRTCPDGSVFPFFLQATDGFRMAPIVCQNL